jgi:hypothetical protein
MTNLDGLVQMLKNEHARLTKQVDGISAALAAFGATYANGTRTRPKISAAGKARIAAAQRARWAKVKAKNGKNVVTLPKKRTMSAAARRKIAAAQRARWAKVKAAKKSA